MPESAGLYFSWGNTDGHPSGAQYDFSQAVYDTTPAAAITTDLSLSEDAARANLGQPSRMPTSDEFKELYDNCTYVWTTLNGMNGLLFTSNMNGNTLFLPAAGHYNGKSLSGRRTNGYYWSTAYYTAEEAKFMLFSSLNVYPQSSSERRYGFSIRAVQDGTPNRSIVPPIPEDDQKDEETPTVEEPKDKDKR